MCLAFLTRQTEPSERGTEAEPKAKRVCPRCTSLCWGGCDVVYLNDTTHGSIRKGEIMRTTEYETICLLAIVCNLLMICC